VELFTEIEATLDVTEAVGIEPELKATCSAYRSRAARAVVDSSRSSPAPAV
jgi:hypothetical protein